jgi:hypothetical protein
VLAIGKRLAEGHGGNQVKERAAIRVVRGINAMYRHAVASREKEKVLEQVNDARRAAMRGLVVAEV